MVLRVPQRDLKTPPHPHTPTSKGDAYAQLLDEDTTPAPCQSIEHSVRDVWHLSPEAHHPPMRATQR